MQAQFAELNTNTRYLHDGLVRYTEALLRTLPPALCVVTLVCTGSEANDLALRMAKAATGGDSTIVLDSAYHGHTSTLIGVSPYKYEGAGGAPPPPTTYKVRR